MKKINKAWVRTNKRADGKVYYTAYVRLKGFIFWIIPIFYCHPVIREIFKDKMGIESSVYYLGNEGMDACHFARKDEAELTILEILDQYLDRVQEQKDKRIIGVEDNPVSFGSYNY
jgi:hypothetical protein